MRMEFLREKGEARVLRVSAVLPDGFPSVVEVTLSGYVVLVAEGVVRPDVR